MERFEEDEERTLNGKKPVNSGEVIGSLLAVQYVHIEVVSALFILLGVQASSLWGTQEI